MKLKPYTWGLAQLALVTLLAALVSGPAYGDHGSGEPSRAPVFTGNVEIDFANEMTVVIPDPGGVDVPMHSRLAGRISGWDIKDVRLFYEASTDTLYVGFNTYGIAGDADGDGDPGRTSPELASLRGVDLPDFGGSECFALLIDTDLDGVMDAVAGVSGSVDIHGYTVARHNGSKSVPASFGPTLTENVGGVFGSPTADAPHIEFTIRNFYQLPRSSGVFSSLSFGVRAYMGSLSDIGVGEDSVPSDVGTVVVDFVGIGSTVWVDANGNGYQDPDEPGVPGATVNLLNAAGDVVATTQTDADGTYLFIVHAGSYSVQFVLPEGYAFTTPPPTIIEVGLGGPPPPGWPNVYPSSVANPDTGVTPLTRFTAGSVTTTMNAGLVQPAAPLLGDMGGTVWFDADGNGSLDLSAGEQPAPGVLVVLLDEDGNEVGRTFTDGDGIYTFVDLPAGIYTVLVAAANFAPGGVLEGTQATYDADGGADSQATFVLAAGETLANVDFGYQELAAIGGRVWIDSDGDGVYEPEVGEQPRAGVLVLLYDAAGNLVGSTSTDAEGNYHFENVPPGTVTVVIAPANFGPGGALSGQSPVYDSDGGLDNRSSHTLAAGEVLAHADFGYAPTTPPGTGTQGYWRNHPAAWPVETIEVGGVTYTKSQALALLKLSVKGDATRILFAQLLCAKLNVAAGNPSGCIENTIRAGDAYLVANPLGSNPKGATKNAGVALADTLDAYNNGRLCAPHRG